MSNKRCYITIITLLISSLVILNGCSKISSRVSPGTDLTKQGKFYVVRHTEGDIHIDEMIRDELKKYGINAESGPPQSQPSNAEVVVNYEDRWTWDITMYLISLTIEFRKVDGYKLLATGNSYRPSLERKEPEFMVREIIESLFQKE